MIYRSNSAPKTVSHKAVEGWSDYRAKVAEPTMAAVDKMPPAIRACANDFGYIGVYLAWRRGMTAPRIRAAVANGTFQYND